MKSKITVFCVCVLLCASSTFSTPIGEKTVVKNEDVVKTVEEAGTTTSTIFVRQEEVEGSGAGGIPQTSVSPDITVDEESDEDEDTEVTESPKVASSSLVNSTTTRRPLKTSSFNQEWNIVTGQQPPQPVQPQQPQPAVVPQKQTETETESDTDTDNDNDADNDADTQADDQDKNKNRQDADTNEDEEDEDTPVVTQKVPVAVSTSTPSSSVIEEWAVVTGNETALKLIQDSKRVKTSKPDEPIQQQQKQEQQEEQEEEGKEEQVVPTSTVSSSTVKTSSFLQEWAVVTGNVTEVKAVPSELASGQAQEQEQSIVSSSSTTEEAVTEQPESQSSNTNAVSGTDEAEEDDEEEQAVTEQAVLNSTVPSTTVKSTPSFIKEWEIVSGAAVEDSSSDQLVRGGPHLSDGGQARAGCECGKTPFQVPGDGVNRWPWLAAIVKNGFFAGGRPHCQGTLINNKYVLTAASCMDGILPDRIEVWLTVHDSLKNSGSSSGTLKLAVEKILMHPNYQRGNGENDIALIGLLEPVPIGENNYFVPACVPAGKLDYSGIMGKMAAWGTNEIGQYNQRINNNRLCKQDMPILSNDVCNRDTRHTGRITNNMLCAGFITPKVDGNCVSDAGGGLMISNGGRHTLIGITSFGYTPNRAYSPTVHTRVSEYPDWVLHNTLDAEWCN